MGWGGVGYDAVVHLHQPDQERRKEGKKERRKEGKKERLNEGTKERRNEGTKERRNEGTKERRWSRSCGVNGRWEQRISRGTVINQRRTTTNVILFFKYTL